MFNHITLLLRDIHRRAERDSRYDVVDTVIDVLLVLYKNSPKLQEEFPLPTDYLEYVLHDDV